MSEIERAGDFEKLVLQAAVLKVLNAKHKAFKAEVTKAFEAGDKKAVKNAQGVELGSVSMTAPNMRAVCTDDAILMAMADEHGMEIIDGLPADPEALQKCVNLIFEHAPDLLSQSISTDDRKEIEQEVLEQWQVTGKLPVGWEIKQASEPSLRVTPARNALAKRAIEYQVQQHTALLELEAGDD